MEHGLNELRRLNRAEEEMVMKYLMLAISIVLYTGLFAVVNGKDAAGLPAIVLKEESNPGFRYDEGDLSDSERAGAEVWLKATGGDGSLPRTSLHQESLRLKLHALPQRPDGEENGRVQRVGTDQ